MTPPLPPVQYGNTASDIGSAVSSFAQGLQAERARRRDEAMKNALMQIQMMKLMQPEYIHQIGIANGQLRNQLVDKLHPGNIVDTGEAPVNQWFQPSEDTQGNLTTNAFPRSIPGAPGVTVQQPPGQYPRSETPIPIQVQTPGGASTIMQPRRPPHPGQVQPTSQAPVTGGQPSAANTPPQAGAPLPRPATSDEEARARFAFDMIQGRYEAGEALKAAGPNAANAYDEAARYIASLKVGEAIPILGGTIEAIIDQSQSVLSPPAARYFRAFMHSAAAKAFSQGGRTLTRIELNAALRDLSPSAFQDPTVKSQVDRLWNGVIAGAVAGNNAWMNYREMAKALGYDDTNITPGLVAPTTPQPDINPLTGLPRQRKH